MAAQRKPLVMDHDDLVASLIEVRDQPEREKAVAAFVVGLRNRRLDLRSPLGSYAFHLNHPLHKLDPFDPSAGTVSYLGCKRCAFFSNKGRRDVEIDFDYYDGLRSTSTVSEDIEGPDYAFADLTLFSDVEVPRPADEDWGRIRELLKRVRNLSSDARLGLSCLLVVRSGRGQRRGRRVLVSRAGSLAPRRSLERRPLGGSGQACGGAGESVGAGGAGSCCGGESDGAGCGSAWGGADDGCVGTGEGAAASWTTMRARISFGWMAQM
jgi:hypothetical protein